MENIIHPLPSRRHAVTPSRRHLVTNQRKKIFSLLALTLSGFLLFHSCDKIEAPYLRSGVTPPPIDSTKLRKVLIEEFTGQRCRNCPAASVIAHELQAEHPAQVILLSIHAGTYAVPQAAPFDYDFRTSAGDSLNDHFLVSGYPSGMVSRVQSSPGNYLITQDLWESTLDTIITKPAMLSMKITNAYNAGTRKATASIQSTFFSDADTTYNLCVFLTENNIIKAQQFPDSIYYHYTHTHVLRGTFTGAFGNQIANSNTQAGSVITKAYNMVLGSDWVPANCIVIAFVYRTDTYEIVQVEEKALE